MAETFGMVAIQACRATAWPAATATRTSASNPQTFPKFQADLGRVIPLRDMINWCITTPQAGTALDVNSADMIAMEAYAFYLYRGKQISPGLATEQTSPVVVKSGPGYPKKGSGVGYDK